jgi:para-nitrobenzyl esterase
MPFGTQYGHAPLPAEEEIEDAWNATAPGIEVLIGHTSDEARLFMPRTRLVRVLRGVPVLGSAAVKAINRAVTEAVYGRAARRFARRHAGAGGKAHSYMLSWGAPGNFYRAAHTIDLPLLFGNRQTWAAAGLLTGATWDETDAVGREVRRLWASFARGDGLDEAGGIPGVLEYRAAE